MHQGHLEVARFFKRPETQRLLMANYILTDFNLEERRWLATYYSGHGPFATEKGWEQLGREPLPGQGPIKMADGREVYPIRLTSGDDIPELLEECELGFEDGGVRPALEWVMGLLDADKIEVVPFFEGRGYKSAYQPGKHQIHLAQGLRAGTRAYLLLRDYMTSLMLSTPVTDPDERANLQEEVTVVTTAATHLVMSERFGLHSEWALQQVVGATYVYPKYLEYMDEIDAMTDYFAPVELPVP